MLAAEAPDVHGLETADPAVILYLDAGEMPQHIGHLGGRGNL